MIKESILLSYLGDKMLPYGKRIVLMEIMDPFLTVQ